MTLADAKIVLSDLYNKQISDSLIEVYMIRDEINTSTISLLKTDVDLYIKKCNNLNIIINNDTKIIDNKDTEIALLNETINTQKKEIIKQKVLKIMGFTAAVVLPITTILLMAK